MSERKDYKVGDIAEVQTGPFGSQLHMSDYVESGTPIITVEHFGENRILHTNLPLVSNEDRERLKKYTLREGDIVFSRVGSVDRRVYVTAKENGWMFSGRCLRVRCNQDIVNAKYLSYYFGQESFKEYIRMVAVGATMPSINTQILSEASLSIPPLPEQEAIAEVLSSLDDKIDLLHRNNKTLEQLAETLFRQWFVEDARNEWEHKKVSDYGKIICGKTPSKAKPEFFEGCTPFLKIPDMHGRVFVLHTADSLTESGKNSQLNKTLPPYSISVSCIATVGLVSMNIKECQTNQQINSVIPYKAVYRYFLYLFFKNNTDELIQLASGGSVTHNINTTDFSNITIPFPGIEILREFDGLSSPIFEKILANTIQIQQLETLRDTLLPKLMSGAVRV